MKFGSCSIPYKLHAIARERMEKSASFTPSIIRDFLLKEGDSIISEITDIPTNKWIIADRVFRVELKSLIEKNVIGQMKRGLWIQRTILDAK